MDYREAVALVAKFEANPDSFKDWHMVASVLDAVNVLRTPPSSLLLDKANQMIPYPPGSGFRSMVVPYNGGWRIVHARIDAGVNPTDLANE